VTELQALRLELDKIDSELVKLFERRMALSLAVGRYKKANRMAVLDSKREADVLESRMQMCTDESGADDVRKLYECIMALSREKQTKLLLEEGPNA
jgi:Chorismate mutase